MYYDPMISKLITWGKDRKEALDLLATAMDEYVIRGVIHNVGFGRSILRNNDFATGKYSTAFIPTYYPTGFKGDPLDFHDHVQIAISTHFLKNLKSQQIVLQNQQKPAEEKVFYVSIKGEKDQDYKVEKKADGTYEVTEMETGKKETLNIDGIDLEYGTLLRFKQNNDQKLIQFTDVKEEIHYNFYLKGNNVEALVYD